MNETPSGPYDVGDYDIRHFQFVRTYPLPRPVRWHLKPSPGFWQGVVVAGIVMLLLMGMR